LKDLTASASGRRFTFTSSLTSRSNSV
jgi:hypothetical protein